VIRRYVMLLLLAGAMAGCSTPEAGVQDWDATRDDGTEIPAPHGQDLIPSHPVRPM
jgi:PBP1b-binding outer membrane lipoprotein LpoB